MNPVVAKADLIEKVTVPKSWCVHKIANLEGLKNAFSELSECGEDLISLDGRVRRLEMLYNVAALPPMTKPSWETIQYRLQRLDNQPTFNNTVTIAMADNSKAMDLDDAKLAANAALVYYMPYVGRPRTGENKDTETVLSELAQRLCYVAGQYRIKAGAFDDTVQQVYDFAIQLSLVLETTYKQPGHHLPGPGVHPGMSVMPGGRPPMPGANRRKGCCGCCGCTCHNNNRPIYATPRGLTKRELERVLDKRSWKRAFRFKWLKKVWPFGRRTSYHSDTTSSSSGNSTLAD